MVVKTKYKALSVILIVIALSFLFYTFFIQIRRVESDSIGIKASISNAAATSGSYDITLVQGYVCFMPLLTELTVYPTNIQSVTYDDLVADTKDVLPFKIKSTISYQLNEKNAIKFYRTCGRSLEKVQEDYLKNIVRSVYMTQLNRFTSDSLIQNKQVLDYSIDSLLSISFNEIGLELHNVVCSFEYPKEVKERLSLRAKAAQDQIIANTQKVQAENYAQIQQIEADATRYQDSLVNSALTPLAVQKMFVDKWDGKLPACTETPKIYKDILSQ